MPHSFSLSSLKEERDGVRSQCLQVQTGRILTLSSTPSPRPSGERGGVRGFELKKCKSATSPQPSPPTSLAEREDTRTVSRCTRTNPSPPPSPGFGATSQPSPRLDGERELFSFGAYVKMHPIESRPWSSTWQQRQGEVQSKFIPPEGASDARLCQQRSHNARRCHFGGLLRETDALLPSGRRHS